MSNPLDLSDLTAALAELTINSTNSRLETSSDNNFSDTMAPPLDRHAFDFIPDFDGTNPDTLNSFIRGLDLIVERFGTSDPSTADAQYQNFQITSGILSKLKGQAKQTVTANLCDDWISIKDILKRTFADPRDESELMYELVNLRPKPNQKYIDYYNDIYKLVSLYISKLNPNQANSNIVKKEIIHDFAIKNLCKYSIEPIGTMLRTIRPKDLTEIRQLIENESKNIGQFPKQRFNTNNIKPHNTTTQHHNIQTNNSNNWRNLPSNPFTNLNPRPIQHRFPTNAQVFGNKNNYPPKQQGNVNVFKPNQTQRFNLPTPTPMSIGYTNQRTQMKPTQNYPNRNNFFKQTGPPQFISEELRNMETNETPVQDVQNYCETDNYSEYYDNSEYESENTPTNNETIITGNENENFCITASETETFQEPNPNLQVTLYMLT